MNWKERIELALRNGMRYAFKPDTSGSYPTIDEVEFSGRGAPEGDLSPFLYQVLDTVNEIRRVAFFRAYTIGRYKAVSEGEMEEANKLTIEHEAWKKWLEYDKL